MLKNDFYFIQKVSGSIPELSFEIKLNAGHEIYKGHFPGNPVTPGVVQMDIVKELLEEHYGREVKMVGMSRCKFLKILNPNDTPVVTISISIHEEAGKIKANASAQSGDDTYFKISSLYQ